MFGIVIVIYYALALALGGGVKWLERRVNRHTGRGAHSAADGPRSSVPAWALGGDL